MIFPVLPCPGWCTARNENNYALATPDGNVLPEVLGSQDGEDVAKVVRHVDTASERLIPLPGRRLPPVAPPRRVRARGPSRTASVDLNFAVSCGNQKRQPRKTPPRRLDCTG